MNSFHIVALMFMRTVCTLVNVCFLVLLQIPWLTKTHVTLCTLKRFFPSMHPFMSLQVWLITKTFSTMTSLLSAVFDAVADMINGQNFCCTLCICNEFPQHAWVCVVVANMVIQSPCHNHYKSLPFPFQNVFPHDGKGQWQTHNISRNENIYIFAYQTLRLTVTKYM